MSSEKIKLIYEKNRTVKGSDVLTPILFIILVFSLFSHLYTTVQKKLLQANWDEQKCNPRYLFFSGFLNPLDKNPWSTSLSNFQKCVANNIYKDKALTKDINQNRNYIKKTNIDLNKTKETSKKIIHEINEKWTNILENKQTDLNELSMDKNELFEQQGTLYKEVAKKSVQLFNVIKSVIVYIQGILVYKVSNYKEKLNIDKVHSDFMTKYQLNYEKYKRAYESLDNRDWFDAINTARDAIKTYNDMTKEVDDFMATNAHMIFSITESCYQLKYNMGNDTCNTVLPNLNQDLIDYYPILKTII
jgi:hypothetical protein